MPASSSITTYSSYPPIRGKAKNAYTKFIGALSAPARAQKKKKKISGEMCTHTNRKLYMHITAQILPLDTQAGFRLLFLFCIVFYIFLIFLYIFSLPGIFISNKRSRKWQDRKLGVLSIVSAFISPSFPGNDVGQKDDHHKGPIVVAGKNPPMSC